MPGTLGEITGVTIGKSGVTVAGLVYGQAGLLLTQAALSAVSYQVTRYAADGFKTVTGAGALLLSAVVFDQPQTDPRYRPAGGFNFLATIPASCFQAGGLRHRIAVTFTPASGEPFVQTWSSVPLDTGA